MTNEPENKHKENVSGTAEGAAKPKKKKPIMIFRPQNSKTGMVKAGQRPGTKAKKPVRKPAVTPQSADEAAKRVTKPASEAASAQDQAAAAIAAAAAGAAKDRAAAPAQKPAPASSAAVRPETAAASAAAPAAPKKQEEADRSQPAARVEEPKAQGSISADKGQASAAKEPAAAVKETPAAQPQSAAEKSHGATQETETVAHVSKETSRAQSAASSASGTGRDNAQSGAARSGDRGGNSRNRSGASSGRTYSRDGQSGGYRQGGSRESGSGNTGRGGSGTRDGQGSGYRQGGSRGGYGSRDGQGASSRPYSGRDFGGYAGRSTAGTSSRTGSGTGSGKAGYGTGGTRGAGHGTGTGGRPGFGSGTGRSGGARPSAGEKPFEKESRKNNDRGRKQNNRPEKDDKFDRLERSASNNNSNTHGKSRNNVHGKQAVKAAPVQEEEKIKSITIPEKLTIKDLADKLKVAPAQIIKKLFLQGKMVTINEEIDFATAEEIALDYDVLCEKEVKVNPIEELLREEDDPEETKVPRPPVVCVMGHVDHGKTSLLDAIRHTHVIDREAGGITQHIGASVVTCNGQKITFLDTPGHEAFTAMRMRGANSTDIAILVVAADDGVMPQTVEAINHAKAAGIEIIVAINKIDKPGANVEKVKQELTEYGLVPEDWGGSTIFVPVSAKTHEGIDTLLEMILLTAEVLELKANPNRRARGLVIEAKLDKGKGPVATVLIQKGTLHVGDPIAAGACYGKVRAMIDDKGNHVKEAGPSMPVEVQGFSGVPGAGEIMVSPETEKEARNFSETFIREGREKLIEDTKQKMTLDDLFSQIQAGNLKELNLIVKADVQGSVEAVKQSLLKLSTDEVVVKIIHSAVGAITESDVILASASDAIIIGFNVRPDAQAKATAEQEGVDIRLYKVIYDAIADVEAAMKGMLDPIYEEKVIGHAEVRQTFRASGVGTIAGSYVLDGVIQRGCSARITRDGKQIFDGQIASLKRFKDDVKEVKAGYECGLVLDKFNDVAEGDQIEAYTMVEVPRT